MDTRSKVEKGAGKRKGGGKKNKPISQSQKAGLLFPVGRIRCYLKRGRYAERISASAPIYMAAVLKYLVAEVLEFAGNVARANKKSSITPKHVSRAMLTEEDLGKLLDGVTISQGGVIPNI